MNPLEQYPSVRKFLYTVQWIYNGLAAVVGAYFTVNGTAVEDLPKWYVLALGIAPVFWTYLGLTASANTPSVRDVQEGRADLNERGYSALEPAVGVVVLLILVVVLLRLV